MPPAVRESSRVTQDAANLFEHVALAQTGVEQQIAQAWPRRGGQ
jgi:hypothetical protein